VTVWLWFSLTPPALTLDLVREPLMAWLWFGIRAPALTLLLTRSPLTDWLWFGTRAPAFTFDLILIFVSPSILKVKVLSSLPATFLQLRGGKRGHILTAAKKIRARNDVLGNIWRPNKKVLPSAADPCY
jgi:hypothetical protein